MKRFRGVASLLLATTLSMGLVTPASAVQTAFEPTETGTAAGLIIKYRSGVEPIAPDGLATGSNAAKVALSFGHALSTDIYTADFEGDLPIVRAREIAASLEQDPRVEMVSINHNFAPASLSLGGSSALTALRAASAVQSLKVVDAYNKATPATATVRLSWKAPRSLFGAKVTGYIVEYSSDAGQSYTAIKRGTALSYTMNTALEAGTRYTFRVKAVTKLGSASRAGTASAVVAVRPTTAPQAPILASGNVVTSVLNPTWIQQSLAQQGGLPVTYVATATAAGLPAVTCTTISNTCAFVGLSAGINYALSLVATNTRGSVSAVTEFKPADEYYSSQWHLFSAYGINLPKAWNYTRGTKSVVVAVIDSGITKHPDLDSQVVPGYDFVSDSKLSNDGDGWDSDASDPGDYEIDSRGNFQDSGWHGTHVAGIVAAASNAIGTTGVAPSVLIQPIRALGIGGGNKADLIVAINWAAGLNVPGVPRNPTPAKVINLSIGTAGITICDDIENGGPLFSTGQALKAAKAAGVTTITAAGNENTDARFSYPGNCFPTINVGATGFSGDRASYSNFTVASAQGVGVDISAPGGDSRDQDQTPPLTKGKIFSTSNDGQTKPGKPTYRAEEGTSMSAPVVAGVIALLYSIKPTISFDEAWTILSKTVTPFKPGGQCASSTTGLCGIGIVNAGAAVEMLLSQR
jgi:serine protease